MADRDEDADSLLPPPGRDVPHPDGARRRRPARLRRSSRTWPPAPDGELKLSAGTLYRSIQRMLEQGLIVEVARAPGARARRRAAAVLPDHALRNRGGARGGAPADRARPAGARQRLRAPGRRDAPLPRAAAPLSRRRSAPSTATRCARSSRERRRDAAGPFAVSRSGWRRSPTSPSNALRVHARHPAAGPRATPPARSARSPGFAATAILVVGARRRRDHRRLLDHRPRPRPAAAVRRARAAGEALAGPREATRARSSRRPTTATGSA